MFKPHIAVCICHNKRRLIVVKAGYCAIGNAQQKAAKGKKPKPIRPVSDKRQALNAAYSILRAQFLKNNPICRARITGECAHHAADVHHKKGRGPYLLDDSTWLPVCRPCHSWIENNPEEAKKLNLSLSRLAK